MKIGHFQSRFKSRPKRLFSRPSSVTFICHYFLYANYIIIFVSCHTRKAKKMSGNRMISLHFHCSWFFESSKVQWMPSREIPLLHAHNFLQIMENIMLIHIIIHSILFYKWYTFCIYSNIMCYMCQDLYSRYIYVKSSNRGFYY